MGCHVIVQRENHPRLDRITHHQVIIDGQKPLADTLDNGV